MPSLHNPKSVRTMCPFKESTQGHFKTCVRLTGSSLSSGTEDSIVEQECWLRRLLLRPIHCSIAFSIRSDRQENHLLGLIQSHTFCRAGAGNGQKRITVCMLFTYMTSCNKPANDASSILLIKHNYSKELITWHEYSLHGQEGCFLASSLWIRDTQSVSLCTLVTMTTAKFKTHL